MKDRPTNQMSVKVVEAADGPTLQSFVRERLVPGATLHSDEQAGYKGLRHDYDHHLIHHSAGDTCCSERTPTGWNRGGHC